MGEPTGYGVMVSRVRGSGIEGDTGTTIRETGSKGDRKLRKYIPLSLSYQRGNIAVSLIIDKVKSVVP
jgi:hypothetical protein